MYGNSPYTSMRALRIRAIACTRGWGAALAGTRTEPTALMGASLADAILGGAFLDARAVRVDVDTIESA
jgi:hypothetical protein